MKIESIIQRKNGTTVKLGNTTYHFKPDAKGGPHIADVDDEGHAERLLSITEGFREASAKTTKQTQSQESTSSTGSTVLHGADGAGTGAEADAPAPGSRPDTTETDAKVLELLGQSITKIKSHFPVLTDFEIDTAIAFEKATEQPRSSLLDALAAEKARRAADAD